MLKVKVLFATYHFFLTLMSGSRWNCSVRELLERVLFKEAEEEGQFSIG
jgi:hypothetical protein